MVKQYVLRFILILIASKLKSQIYLEELSEELSNAHISVAFANTVKFAIFLGGEMKKVNNRYVIIGDGKVIKFYKTLKEALWDYEFFTLMYSEVFIYQLVIKDGEQI